MAWWNFWRRPKLELTPPPGLPPAPPARKSIAATSFQFGEGWVQHPGWGLTAEAIRSAFLQAERGWPAVQCDIFDDVLERDGHLRSQVETRIEAVSGKDWILQAGGDDQVDVDAARQLELALRRIPSIQEAIEHLLTAPFFGWAALEIEWERVDGQTMPVWLAPVPHRRFRFMPDTDEPRLITKDASIDGEALQPGKWMFVRMRGRCAARAGLLRTATWWSWMKSLSLRDWQIFSSRFGIPFVVATHPEGANEEQMSVLRETILAFGKQGGALVPAGSEIDIKELGSAGNSESVHPAFVEMCNREISKLISGATLTSSGGEGAGSYAQARVHADRSFDRTMSDAQRLGTWFASQLGRMFVHFNGLNARWPRQRARIVREVDPLQRAQIADIFVNRLGGSLDEDQMRDEWDFKRPTGGTLSGVQQAPASGSGDPPPADS